MFVTMETVPVAFQTVQQSLPWKNGKEVSNIFPFYWVILPISVVNAPLTFLKVAYLFQQFDCKEREHPILQRNHRNS
jgi:hypothetical protein